MEERERLQAEIKKLLAENEELRISYLQLHNQLEKGEGASYGPRKVCWAKTSNGPPLIYS
jgi:hypothetical protein